jgi:predicted SAM-dependent methyltransferase
MLEKLFGWWRLKKTQLVVMFGMKVKIIVGAGESKRCGWLETDIDILDITDKNSWKRLFGNKKVSNILAEHVLEHLTNDEIEATLLNVADYLKIGGKFRVAVPDGYHPSRYVIDLVKPGGLEHGADDHKVLLNIVALNKMAKTVGLRVVPLEYFDDKGTFHCLEWKESEGYISRSYKNYRGRFTDDKSEYEKFITSIPVKLRNQFVKSNFTYTSLLVDFIK